MSATESATMKSYAHSSVFQAAMALFFFLFAFFKVDPRLIFYAQEPIFFYSGQFLSKFTSYPGGLSVYIANFLSQFYYFKVTGALFIVALLWLLFIAVRVVFRYFGKSIPLFEYAFVVTASLFLIQFKFPVVILIALLLALLGFYVYTRFKNNFWSFLLFVLWSVFLYYVLAGAFFVYALLVLFASIKEKKLPVLVSILLLAFSLPFLSYSLFLTTFKQLFLFPFLTFSDFNISVVLYVMVPILAILSIFTKFLTSKKNILWIQFALILILTIFLHFSNFDSKTKSFWKINYLADKADWQGVLEQADSFYLLQPQMTFQINRALLHTGELCNRAFAFNQQYGIYGIFLHEKLTLTSPRIRGDFFFDLGNFNEAKHWAHEAMTANGRTIANLKRLSLIYLLYGEHMVAEKYLNLLDQTLLAKSWAKHYKQFLYNDKNLMDDPILAAMSERQIQQHFLTFVNDPESDLKNILKYSSNNKYAFEYLSILYLLQKRIHSFVALHEQYPQYSSDPLPVHFQEAYLFNFARNKHQPTIKLNPEILKDFRTFYGTLQKNAKNPGIKSVLQSTHGSTYWYYLNFVKPTGI